MAPENAIVRAHTAALQRWSTPFAGFTSGHDPRTSDNALLIITYGGLVHAADHAWQNAGRRLIDKTYIDILWHVQGLSTIRTCRAEQIAAALDNFIRDQVAAVWDDLPALNDTERADLGARWVEEIAQRCFGSLTSELAASRLLFFLCPMLALFNLSRGHLLGLEHLAHCPADDGYRAFASAARSAYQDLVPALRALPRPIPTYGDPAQQALIEKVLNASDWWERRVFDELLRQIAAEAGVSQPAFGCDDAGQLTP